MAQRFLHKKSLGQHFLTSDVVPNWMCDAAAVSKDDTVLEVGPGTGILTRELLKRGAQVVALETDERAVKLLEEDFTTEINRGQLTIYHTDVRELDLTELSEIDHQQYKVVANIPYYLSGFLFRLFLESSVQPNTLVFLVQKEVARRLTSLHEKGEKESLLSLSAQAYGNPSYYKTVGRGHFQPPPKVDSGIVVIENISKASFEKISETDFFITLHRGFAQKRKQLLGNLARHYPREELTNIFSTLSLALDVRAEDIPLKTWLLLTTELTHNSSTGS